MSMKLLEVLLMAAVGLIAAEITPGTCPQVKNVDDFNPEDVLGRFYEIERIPADFMNGLECITADFVAIPDNDTMVLVNISGNTINHEIKTLPGYSTFTNVTGQFNSTIQDAPNLLINLLETDHVYASFYACNQVDENYMDQYAWLDSRKEQLSEDEVKKARAAYAKNNIDVGLLMPTLQGGDCKYLPPPPQQ